MSREAKIRATAAAMHPKSIDLAAMRQRSTRDNDFHVRPEIAAGALAYASSHDGDPLPSLMLRLKHARWRTAENYKAAGELLLYRYKGLSCTPSRTMQAVAMAALYEWVNDHCTCRVMDGAKRSGDRERGIRCLSCNATGRVTFDPRKRARLVSELIAADQKACGEKVTGFPSKRFGAVWNSKYWKFIDVLRMIDKHEVGVLAFGFKAIHTSPIETESIDDDVSMEVPE